MIYDWNYHKRVQCSKEEKEKCAELIQKIISLTDKAKREGLLALEDDLSEIKWPLLQKGVGLVVDGIDPELIRKTMEISILSGNYKGRELIERCIIAGGVILMQDIANPQLIREFLTSFIGENIKNNPGMEAPEQLNSTQYRSDSEPEEKKMEENRNSRTITGSQYPTGRSTRQLSSVKNFCQGDPSKTYNRSGKRYASGKVRKNV